MRFLISFITLFITFVALADNSKWMADLPDNVPVRTVSLPGAHDAATKGVTILPSSSQTQSKSLEELFDAGVRAFDLRPKYSGNQLSIYHGIISANITMEEALTKLINKVQGTTEFAVIIIRDEDSANSSEWAVAISSLLNKYDNNFAVWQKGMTVGDARGKIIALSRNSFESGKVGFISGWNHNEINRDVVITLGENRARLIMQDNYENPAEATKKNNVRNLLDFSSSNSGKNEIQCWVINHTSYVPGTLGSPKDAAKAINPAALEFINNGSGSTGILLMDFAGDDTYSGQKLVDAIIARNFK